MEEKMDMEKEQATKLEPEQKQEPVVSAEAPRMYSIVLHKDKITRFDFKALSLNAQRTLGITGEDESGAEKLSELKKLVTTRSMDQVILADGILHDHAVYVQSQWTLNGFDVTIEESEAPMNEEKNEFIAATRFGSIRCPRCGSNDLGFLEVKISAFGGVLDSGDSMVCKSCGFKWTPEPEEKKEENE